MRVELGPRCNAIHPKPLRNVLVSTVSPRNTSMKMKTGRVRHQRTHDEMRDDITPSVRKAGED